MSAEKKSTNEYREIEWEEFIAEFKPLKNPLDDNASFDGFMLETYGDEFKAIQTAAVDVNRRACIWTVVDDGDKSLLISGFHFVDRLGYVLTESPCPEHQHISVL